MKENSRWKCAVNGVTVVGIGNGNGIGNILDMIYRFKAR